MPKNETKCNTTRGKQKITTNKLISTIKKENNSDLRRTSSVPKGLNLPRTNLFKSTLQFDSSTSFAVP